MNNRVYVDVTGPVTEVAGVAIYSTLITCSTGTKVLGLVAAEKFTNGFAIADMVS